MFCKNCGQKLTESDKFCPSCGEAITNEVNRPVQYSEDTSGYQDINQPAQLESINYNGCIGAFVMALIGSFIAEVALGIMMPAFMPTYEYGSIDYAVQEELIIVAIVFAIIALALLIPSLILGIKSIKFAKRAKVAGKKATKTLVFGIIATVIAGFSLLYVLIIFLVGLGSIGSL